MFREWLLCGWIANMKAQLWCQNHKHSNCALLTRFHFDFIELLKYVRMTPIRGVFRTQSNIYDEAFLKILNGLKRFLLKSSIIDVRLGSKYASTNNKITTVNVIMTFVSKWFDSKYVKSLIQSYFEVIELTLI